MLTANQHAVLAVLTETNVPLSAYDVLKSLEGSSIRAPVQVYRALQRLTETGDVHRVESLNAFVACRHPGKHSQYPVGFAICTQCGSVCDFLERTVQKGLADWSNCNAFKTQQMTIELRGICETCQESH